VANLETISVSPPANTWDAVPDERGKTAVATSILIVDDEPMVVQGLKQILTAQFPVTRFGHATDSDEAIDFLSKEPWSVVLLVCGLSSDCPITVVKRIRRVNPNVPMLIITGHSETECAIGAINAGVNGCVSSRATPEELGRAIRRVISGGCYTNLSLVERMAATRQAGVDRTPQEILSHREIQVLQMILAGEPLKEIAFNLDLSVKTISTYRTRAMRKLRITTDIDLVRYATVHKLVCRGAVCSPVALRGSQ
jgi:DNA-binding NarL/FixJ family response regulator